MIRRVAIGLAALVFVIVVGGLALAWRPAIAPIAPPSAASFPADLVARGQSLAGAGYCAVCHTRDGGPPFAGGYGLGTPFGTVYSTNITPDPETGIGRWSEQAFARAMRNGVARDGSHLFPAMPYDSFTKISDDDVRALYAYLMTRPAVRASPQADTIPFPFNFRPLQAGWKLLFFHPGRYQHDASKSAEWNRGAYLAEGLSHCGGCHTPRNALGAEEEAKAYTGAGDNWIAPALDATNPSPVTWTTTELFGYLRSGGTTLHGATAGSMAPVVHQGLSALPDTDVQAIAVYFADFDHAASRSAGDAAAVRRAMATSRLGLDEPHDADARLYVTTCGSCHINAGSEPLATRPELALNSALTLSEPTNFIQVVLKGISAKEGAPGLIMPGYASALSDGDIARLAKYLRRTRTNLPAWTDVETRIAAIRKVATQ